MAGVRLCPIAGQGHNPHLNHQNETQGCNMNAIGFVSRISMMLRQVVAAIMDFLDNMEAARASAAAVEARVSPRAADLRRLGIDPRAFARIRRM